MHPGHPTFTVTAYVNGHTPCRVNEPSVGITAFAPNPTMKIDYWFSDASGRAQAISSAVLNGAQSVSDHYPIQATFVIR